MFSSLIDSATQLFFGEKAAPQVAPANDVGPDPVLATGTPSPAAATALFGGMFGGGETPALLERFAPGMMAGVRARTELSQLLEIDGAGPNGVSAEEYEQLVQMVADIDLGRTDIAFAGMNQKGAAEKKALAMKDMTRMLRTQSGREMLSSLAYNDANQQGEHRTTTLQFIDDLSRSACSVVPGETIEENQELAARDHNQVGNDVVIRYAPGQTFDQRGTDGYEIHHTADTTLFHEMVHAHHRTRGTLAGDSQVNPVHIEDAGIDLDEYQATGLGPWVADRLTENEYRAELQRLGDDIGFRHRYNAGTEDDHHHDH